MLNETTIIYIDKICYLLYFGLKSNEKVKTIIMLMKC